MMPNTVHLFGHYYFVEMSDFFYRAMIEGAQNDLGLYVHVSQSQRYISQSHVQSQNHAKISVMGGHTTAY